MRNVRAAVAAALVLSLFAALSSGPATAAATGTGTSTAETTVLGVEMGTDGALLSVRLLGDNVKGTIESAAQATSSITGLSVNSSVDALDTSSGELKTQDPGGEKQVTQGSVNLSSPAPGVSIDPAVVSGTIGLTSLSSNATSTKSVSTIAASLTNATVGGALASVDGVSSTVTASAADTASESTRSVKVDEVVVLDLGAFLEGLGLNVLDLPVQTATALLDSLNLDVGDVANDAVQSAVDDLQAQIDTLTPLLSVTAPTLPTGTTVDSVIDLINGIGVVTVPSTTETTIAAQTGVTQIQSLIDQLQSALATLLTQVALELDTSPLLAVDAVEASVVTKAADTVANSSAKTTATIGSVTVGGITIPGTDLLKTKEQIDATVAAVTAPLDDVLGAIDDELESMITVRLLEPVSGAGVSTANGYVKAVEGVTALRVTVTPPSTLTTIVDTVIAASGLDAAITAADGTHPQLDSAMDTVKSALGGVRSLSGGGTVRLAQVLGTSQFKVSAAGTGGPGTSTGTGTPGEGNRSLPATGQSSTLPLTALAILLVALGLGFREWVHMPVRPIRIPTRTR